MLQASEIRDQIIDQLTGKLSLEDFEDWLAQRSWNIHLDSSHDAQLLAADVQLQLAEFSLGHLSENELRKELISFVRNIAVHSELSWEPNPSLSVNTTSNSRDVPISWDFASRQPAGMQFALAAA
jgi:hypothetical protein